MKKILSAVLALSLSCSLLSINSLPTAFCETETETETTTVSSSSIEEGVVYECEYDDLSWSYENKVLKIYGEGDMYDYHRPYDVPWYDVREEIEEVIIEDGVTCIGKYAFNWCKSLVKVTMPDTILSINKSAFDTCTSLEELRLSSNLQTIVEDSFYNCTSLLSLDIPDSVITIEPMAFNKCTSLEYVNFGENSQLKEIGSYAFQDCSSLKQLIIPDSVTTMGQNVIYKATKLEYLVIGKGITNLKVAEYYGSIGLKEVVIRGDIETIPMNCFYNCYNLKSITLPDTVTTIGSKAFYYCISLYSIDLPESVTDIADDAFEKSGVNLTTSEPDVVFSAGNVYVTPDYAGKTVTVPIKITGNTSYGRSRLTLIYNDELTYVDTAIDLMGWIYMERTLSSSTIILGECYKSEDGILANITFTLPESLEVGDEFLITPTDFTLEDDEETGYDNYATEGGKIIIVDSIQQGDVNDDTDVNVADVVAMQRFILRNSTAIDFNTSDLNNDGKVNVIDLAILKNSI
jgi:hypothetical protein